MIVDFESIVDQFDSIVARAHVFPSYEPSEPKWAAKLDILRAEICDLAIWHKAASRRICTMNIEAQ